MYCPVLTNLLLLQTGGKGYGYGKVVFGVSALFLKKSYAKEPSQGGLGVCLVLCPLTFSRPRPVSPVSVFERIPQNLTRTELFRYFTFSVEDRHEILECRGEGNSRREIPGLPLQGLALPARSDDQIRRSEPGAFLQIPAAR